MKKRRNNSSPLEGIGKKGHKLQCDRRGRRKEEENKKSWHVASDKRKAASAVAEQKYLSGCHMLKGGCGGGAVGGNCNQKIQVKSRWE